MTKSKTQRRFHKWTEILLGVPHRSVHGQILFNTYINDLFFLIENTNVINSADYKTFCACDSDSHNLTLRLEHDSVLAIEWFECNYMKLNQDKCNLLILVHKHESVWAILVLAKFRKVMIKNFLESTLIAI